MVVLFPVPGGPWIFSSAFVMAQTAAFCDSFALGAFVGSPRTKSSVGGGAGCQCPATSTLGFKTALSTGDAGSPLLALSASSQRAASSARKAPTYPKLRIWP